jgi:prepilin-type N-terminal cleavage/methylation domain-containing protein
MNAIAPPATIRHGAPPARLSAPALQRFNALTLQRLRAFTLLELLTVIAIIGLIAAVGIPATRNYNRGNLTATASRQLMDDLSFARQRALASRSEVYVVFVSPGITAVDPLQLPIPQRTLLSNLFLGQFTAYALYSPRTVGDQPGRGSARYLTPWKTLPKGAFIPAIKYALGSQLVLTNLDTPVAIRGFATTVSDLVRVRFPTADSPVELSLPFVGFDYQGRLLSGREEAIPIAEGVVDAARDPASGRLALLPATAVERPAGNWTNQPNVVRVDWLTGRARFEKLEVR